MFHLEEFLVADEVGLTLQSHPGEDIVNVYFIKNNNHYLGIPKLCKQRFIGCPCTLERIMSMLLPIIFLFLFKKYLGFLKDCVVFTTIYMRAREQ